MILLLLSHAQVLERLTTTFTEGRGRGLCRRIIAVVRAANVLGLSFSEAFAKQPIEVLQLLSLKAQESFEEAKLLVRTHSIPSASIARILAESFLKVCSAPATLKKIILSIKYNSVKQLIRISMYGSLSNMLGSTN